MNKAKQFYFLESIRDADKADLANDYLRVIFHLVEAIGIEKLDDVIAAIREEKRDLEEFEYEDGAPEDVDLSFRPGYFDSDAERDAAENDPNFDRPWLTDVNDVSPFPLP